MKVTVAVVGRLKASDATLAAAEAEYGKRLRRACSFDVVEHKDEAALLAALPAAAHLYALDERGDLITSRQLADDILGAEQLHGGGAPVVFAIGGADGHSDALRARARRLIAFGRITIAHRLVRVLLLEQLYRGFSILRGEPYHRD
ncbi:MAG: 23S rRNA (pseudouridine(1915)-N(3))-methyltransferase RlmH [Kofleriaceae bacterium]|nr:23S rRNA (pseudouridine(1915)-N(3))-methyltransferase RlmH [Myxococcales bacterium]MCB9562167.1 23S rRNA (pseudouridine(1915)-N(3))-methyltransferase RlmH [Kofleriaceae bacterium]